MIAPLRDVDKVVLLDVGETTLSFNIVPAVDRGDDIEIINTKKGCWQTSNTRELIRVIQERNKECNGNFIHQARIGKLFARVDAEGPPSGGCTVLRVDSPHADTAMARSERCRSPGRQDVYSPARRGRVRSNTARSGGNPLGGGAETP